YLVAEALGHSDVNTTRKHYASMSDAHMRQAAQNTHLQSLNAMAAAAQSQAADAPESEASVPNLGEVPEKPTESEAVTNLVEADGHATLKEGEARQEDSSSLPSNPVA
ncbi:MAG TPA: hypothetical protein PLP25_04995, partial [Candidatus Limiplasma sp.]|nr:hypothetical protein [Candidatus Limiplasma sp.]